ncbi:MAG TPA: sporulation integral membrane protein YtvI [Thermoanaerobacterales bacterium]|nr:sporulation integral membrane protein YtvI [Thermoanaerobacterales bacterium]
MKFYNNLKSDSNLIKILLLLIGSVFTYFFLFKLIHIFLPFIFAIIITLILEPMVSVFVEKSKLPRGVVVFILLSGFSVLLVLILMFLGSSIYVELNKLYRQLPTYSKAIYKQVEYTIQVIERFYTNMPPETETLIKDTVGTILHMITSGVGSIVKRLVEIIWKIPRLLLLIIVTLTSSFFMSKDKDKILAFLYHQIPPSIVDKMGLLKGDLLLAFAGYVKAQLILMCFSFTISAVGLKMMGIDYAILFALLVGIVDALPIIGTGVVFVPWMFFNFFLQNYKSGVYLAVLYSIVLLTRSLLEPRVLGGQIGLYPLVTLMSSYIGYQIFGVIGLIIGPITAVTIKALQRLGIIPKWKETE